MIFGIGAFVFILGLAWVPQSPMLGGMVALGGWMFLQKLGSDQDTDWFIAVVIGLGVIGMFIGMGAYLIDLLS